MTISLFRRLPALCLGLFFFAAASASAQDAAFSEKDLSLYAQAVFEIDQLKKGINDTLITIIEEEGMEPRRYNELMRNSKMPDFEQSTEAEELARYKRVDERMAAIKDDLNANATQAVKDTGIDLKTYVAIRKAVRQDRALRTRIDEMVAALGGDEMSDDDDDDGEASME